MKERELRTQRAVFYPIKKQKTARTRPSGCSKKVAVGELAKLVLSECVKSNVDREPNKGDKGSDGGEDARDKCMFGVGREREDQGSKRDNSLC